MQTITDIRRIFKAKLMRNDIEPNGTIEIIGASFIANEEVIFGSTSMDYVQKEIEWYKSQSLNVYDMHNPPAIWKQVADKDGNINSNYGYLIYSKENNEQYKKVLRELRRDSSSRRAIMIYTRPTIHEEFNVNGMSDFICTNTVQYFIRNDKLHCVVNMRSNDAVYGYKNDYQWQLWVRNELADELRVDTGDIIWQVGSLHVYPRHFDLVKVGE